MTFLALSVGLIIGALITVWFLSLPRLLEYVKLRKDWK